MLATMRCPPLYEAGGRTLAGLGAVKVTVRSACTASPMSAAESALMPEGMSSETIKG